MAITLIINNVDFSEYIQQETDVVEQMRRVENIETAIDGTMIPTLLSIKWDPSFLLKPLPKSKIETLIAMMELETVVVQYTSVVFNNNDRIIEAKPESIRVQFAMNHNGEDIYADTPISFIEV